MTSHMQRRYVFCARQRISDVSIVVATSNPSRIMTSDTQRRYVFCACQRISDVSIVVATSNRAYGAILSSLLIFSHFELSFNTPISLTVKNTLLKKK